MSDIEDSSNLIGISKLINKNHVDNELDLLTIEKEMIGDADMEIIPEDDPVKEFEETIKELSINSGIDLDTEEIEESEEISHTSDSQNDYRNLRSEQIHSSSLREIHSNNTHDSIEDTLNSIDDEINIPSINKYSGVKMEIPLGKSKITGGKSYNNKDHIDEVINVYSGNNSYMTLEEENEEEEKAVLLEDIDELFSELIKLQVDTSRIPHPTKDNSLEEIRQIRRILWRKYDRSRCNNFGTELIIASVQGLGHLFNGKRKFGPYAPNLSGWHNTVRSKLRRMKYETSSIVSQVMKDYNIGPVTRILLELVPSAIIYNEVKKSQKGSLNYSPDQMSEAFDSLRQFDDE